jgi:polyhydroxyalkanoate synthesis regulator protein
MFAPFSGRKENAEGGEKAPPRSGAEIDDLKRQLDEMQKRLDRLGDKGEDPAKS